MALALRLKERLRLWWFRKEVKQNRAVFDDPALHPILVSDPTHGLRVLRPYLIRGLTAWGRAQAVSDHYTYARDLLRTDVLQEIYLRGIQLAARDTSSGRLRLMLYDALGLGREGELRMEIDINGRILHIFAMAIVKPERLNLVENKRFALWIGCSKGPNEREGTSELIKSATKAMQGLRPKALMLYAAQALAAGWGLEGLYGVANDGTVFAGYASLRKRIKADYDQFWREYEGESMTPYVYRLPGAPAARDLAEIPSNKRAAAARKYAAAQQWFDDIKRATAEMRAG